MNRQKMINDLKQNFMLKRYRAQEEAEEFVSTLRENPEFDKIYSQFNKKQFELLKNQQAEKSAELKQEVENLKAQIDKFLISNNIDEKRLQPQYQCKFCEDTGVHNGKICSCLLNELNRQISMKTSSQTEFKSFDDCKPELMDETDRKAVEVLKKWCNQYPNITKFNINITGGAGKGKTFLLECVAKKKMKKGVALTYITAFELNEQARLYHIGKSYDFSSCLNVDVLFIDDLGTEPILKNVTREYLYNLINIRQTNKLPTFVSSNLSLNDILARYDERIFSRLGNKQFSINIQLTSQDKRIREYLFVFLFK